MGGYVKDPFAFGRNFNLIATSVAAVFNGTSVAVGQIRVFALALWRFGSRKEISRNQLVISVLFCTCFGN